jgi:DNA-binding XRE family transcriptional regulator
MPPAAYDRNVITGSQLRDARLRAGYATQAELAVALGVSLRTVTAWEADVVSPRAEARVRDLLWPAPAPLSQYSDYELLAELGRRLERARYQAGALATRELDEAESEPMQRPPGAGRYTGTGGGDRSPGSAGRQPPWTSQD